MSVTLSHPFVYPQSPFLPEIEKFYIGEANGLILTSNFPRQVAAAQAIAALGIDHYELVSSQADFLLEYFQCDLDGLGYWHMGYTTPLFLIIAIHLDLHVGNDEALRFLLPDDEGQPILRKLNQYRKQMFPHILKSSLSRPNEDVVFDITHRYPAFDHQFFKVGIVAASTNFKQIMPRLLRNVPEITAFMM